MGKLGQMSCFYLMFILLQWLNHVEIIFFLYCFIAYLFVYVFVLSKHLDSISLLQFVAGVFISGLCYVVGLHDVMVLTFVLRNKCIQTLEDIRDTDLKYICRRQKYKISRNKFSTHFYSKHGLSSCESNGIFQNKFVSNINTKLKLLYHSWKVYFLLKVLKHLNLWSIVA